MALTDDMLEAAHRASSHHREVLMKGTRCGCFHCLSVFEVNAIREWIDDGSTALCPKCMVDGVLGETSGLPATDHSFLSAMHERWFRKV